MTIDQLINFLQAQSLVLGGDAPVVVGWDDALSKLEYYRVVGDRVLELRAPEWNSAYEQLMKMGVNYFKESESELMVPQ